MRKSDREITNFHEIEEIVARCQTVRMGLYAEDYPYVVPLSYGYEAENNVLTVYFHCAREGKKIDLLERDARVCLEWDALAGYAATEHSVTADYESVIAFGRAHRCGAQERVKGLELLLRHTGQEGYDAQACAALPIVEVYKVVCEHISGKRRFRRG